MHQILVHSHHIPFLTHLRFKTLSKPESPLPWSASERRSPACAQLSRHCLVDSAEQVHAGLPVSILQPFGDVGPLVLRFQGRHAVLPRGRVRTASTTAGGR